MVESMAVNRHGSSVDSDSIRFYPTLVIGRDISAVVDGSAAKSFCRRLVSLASMDRFDPAYPWSSCAVAWSNLGVIGRVISSSPREMHWLVSDSWGPVYSFWRNRFLQPSSWGHWTLFTSGYFAN